VNESQRTGPGSLLSSACVVIRLLDALLIQMQVEPWLDGAASSTSLGMTPEELQTQLGGRGVGHPKATHMFRGGVSLWSDDIDHRSLGREYIKL
jgi:hypothetical protein